MLVLIVCACVHRCAFIKLNGSHTRTPKVFARSVTVSHEHFSRSLSLTHTYTQTVFSHCYSSVSFTIGSLMGSPFVVDSSDLLISFVLCVDKNEFTSVLLLLLSVWWSFAILCLYFFFSTSYSSSISHATIVVG